MQLLPAAELAVSFTVGCVLAFLLVQHLNQSLPSHQLRHLHPPAHLLHLLKGLLWHLHMVQPLQHPQNLILAQEAHLHLGPQELLLQEILHQYLAAHHLHLQALLPVWMWHLLAVHTTVLNRWARCVNAPQHCKITVAIVMPKIA